LGCVCCGFGWVCGEEDGGCVGGREIEGNDSG